VNGDNAEAVYLDTTSLVGIDVRRRLLAMALDAERLSAMRDELPLAAREILDRMVENARNADRELLALLDAASLARGDFQLAFETTDLVKLVEEVVESTLLATDRARLQIDLRYRGTVTADPPKLARALATLLRGTLDHAPRDTPVVLRLDGSAQHPQLSLIARSLGHLVEEAERAFDGGAPRTGFGVALRTISTMIEAHNGSIAIVTGQDGSASFVMNLVGTATRGLLARR
jgi:K+-sensing histidine kinase KdpD